MKINFFVVLSIFIPHIIFCQPKKQKKTIIARDQYNIQGNQIVNNYYTIFNYSDKKSSLKEKAIAATSGFFKKRKGALSSNPVLKLGSITFGNNAHDIVLERNPIDPVHVSKKNGQINIEAVIRDSNGDEFARISGNIWEISNTQNIEYNNDSSGFEIRTGKRVIFQLSIIKDTVFCNGMMCSESGYCILYSKGGGLSAFKKDASQTQRFVLPPNFILNPLFKYPRNIYLGVRN